MKDWGHEISPDLHNTEVPRFLYPDPQSSLNLGSPGVTALAPDGSYQRALPWQGVATCGPPLELSGWSNPDDILTPLSTKMGPEYDETLD